MDRRSIPRVKTLYDAFAATLPEQASRIGKLHFPGEDGFDVYNITAPFESSGRRVIAGRVERRGNRWT